MTLCIGTICEHEEEPRIIVCSDWQQETSFAGGEISDKLKWLDDDRKWAVLLSDSGGRGNQLVKTLRNQFKNSSLLKDDDVHDFLVCGLSQYKKEITDEYFRMEYAITYDDLLSSGLPESRRRFPDSFVSERLQHVETLALNASLIIAGFTEEHTPALFVINEDAYTKTSPAVRRDDNFVPIGSGAPAALTSLYRRKYIGIDTPLMQAAYLVFEAHKLSGETSPGVGKEDISIDVLSPDGPPQSLSGAAYSYLKRRYAQFGPQNIEEKHKFSFSDRYLEPFTNEWNGWRKRKGATPVDSR